MKVNDQLDKILRDIKKVQIEISPFRDWRIYKNSLLVQCIRSNVIDRLEMEVLDEEIQNGLNVSDHE